MSDSTYYSNDENDDEFVGWKEVKVGEKFEEAKVGVLDGLPVIPYGSLIYGSLIYDTTTKEIIGTYIRDSINEYVREVREVTEDGRLRWGGERLVEDEIIEDDIGNRELVTDGEWLDASEYIFIETNNNEIEKNKCIFCGNTTCEILMSSPHADIEGMMCCMCRDRWKWAVISGAEIDSASISIPISTINYCPSCNRRVMKRIRHPDRYTIKYHVTKKETDICKCNEIYWGTKERDGKKYCTHCGKERI